ncbi:MAG: hypothetical protein DME10_25465, partial [Candidatus Rokuibacteriota bacterium]
MGTSFFRAPASPTQPDAGGGSEGAVETSFDRLVQYSPTLIDHFRNPRNAGVMREPDGVGEDEFTECMDLARFYLRVRDGRVEEARFQAYGCGPTLAACSAG